MHHGGPLALDVRAKEYRRAKYSLERCDQTAILRPALLHSEHVQHFGCAPEGDRLFLLSYSQRCEKNGNQPVLSPRHPVRRMAGDLEKKLAVSALVDQHSFGRSLNRR